MKKTLPLVFMFLSFLLLVSCNDRIEEVKTYTVKFDLAGGTGDFPDQRVKSGEKAVCPSSLPELTGFRSLGWTLRDCSKEKYDFDTPVTSDITLYPIWEMYRTVTFNLDGGTGDITEQEVKFMECAEKPVDPTRTGYDFVRWSEQQDGTVEFDFSRKIDEDIQLYAVWCRVYNVKFDLNGGAGEIWNQEVRADGKVEVPPEPSRDAFDFVSWHKDGKLFSFSEPVTSDITLTATWKRKIYKKGDTGPGGGKVFYDAGEERTSSYVDLDGKTVKYTWRYMEVHNINIVGNSGIVSWGLTGTDLGTEKGIGTGRSNTYKILKHGGELNAANVVYDFNHSGIYDDWFLPSKDEAEELFRAGFFPARQIDHFWTSTEYNEYFCYCITNNVGFDTIEYAKNYLNIAYKYFGSSLLPVRAF